MSGKNTNRQFGLDFGSEDFRSQEALALDAKDFKSLVTDTEKFAPEQFYPMERQGRELQLTLR